MKKKKEKSDEPKKKFSRLKSGVQKAKKAGKQFYIGKRPENFKVFSSNKIGTVAIVVVLVAVILQLLRNR